MFAFGMKIYPLFASLQTGTSINYEIIVAGAKKQNLLFVIDIIGSLLI